jgi:hypothetical protein
MNPQAAKHEETTLRTGLIVGMIPFAAIMRIVPHPWNLARLELWHCFPER